MDLQVLVDEAATLLGAPVTLEDRSFRLLAFSSHGDDVTQADQVRLATVLRRGSSPQVRSWFEQFGIADATGPVRTPASTELGVAARLCLPLREEGITYGYLWVADLGQGEPELARVAPLMRAAAEQLASTARSTRLTDARLQALLGDDARAAERAAAELVGAGRLDAGVDVRVVVLARPVSAPWGGTTLRTELDGRPVLVVQRLATLGHHLPGAPDVVAGVGAAVPAAHAATSLEQARVALQAAQAVPAAGPLAVWDDLGPYRLLGLATATQLRAAVVDARVERLLGDDTLHATAWAYLSCAGSAQRTAQTLHVHRQTLYHRLSRIEALTGLDLDDGDDRLRLHLGLALARATG